MFRVRAVLVPPSLIRGRVRRLVETSDSVVVVQVWSGSAWEVEPRLLVSPDELRRGLDAPARILKALGVPERDWGPEMMPPQAIPMLALLALLDWLQSSPLLTQALAA